LAIKRNFRDDGGRKRQPMTRKEMLLQLGLCVAVLLFFTVKDTFFPAAPKTTPPPGNETVQQQAGAVALDKAAVEALDIKLPRSDGKWNLYVVNWNGATTYTLTSSDMKDLSMETLGKPGYDLGGTTARINVKDIDALTALFKKIPTGDSVTIIGANGLTVDGTLYAQIADAALKGGLTRNLGTWTGPVITPSPSPSASPSASPKK